MDLLGLRGVGPATKEKLTLAGIQTVEDLARVRDVELVAEWSGLSPTQLAPLVEAARQTGAPRPPGKALLSMIASATRVGRTLATLLPFGRARRS